MASKTIVEKVKESLASEAPEYVDQYYRALLESFHRLDKKYHHALLLLLFAIAAFELLAHTSIVEVALGPFKLNDVGFLQKYLPLIIAYSYCSMSSLGTMRQHMRDLTAAVVAINHKSIAKNSMDIFLQPYSLFHTSETSQKFSFGALSKTFLHIEAIVVLALMVGPIIFLGHAFYHCFFLFGFRDVNLWVSLILSFVFVLQSVLVFVHYFRDMYVIGSARRLKQDKER
jgi:hypothetical protein